MDYDMTNPYEIAKYIKDNVNENDIVITIDDTDK